MVEPDYRSLKCTCGNAAEFMEHSLRLSTQRFKVVPGQEAPEWEVFETQLDAECRVLKVTCEACGNVVWEAPAHDPDDGDEDRHDGIDQVPDE